MTDVTRQYYGYNGLFNASRALYISTYALVLNHWLGLDLSLLPWVLVANLIFTMLMELPTGVFADLAGRKRSFLLAVAATGFGYGLYASAILAGTSDWTLLAMIVLAEFLLAVGYTFYSGALEAWMVDLRSDGDSRVLKLVFARGQMIRNGLYILAGLAGIALFQLGQPMVSTFSAAGLLCAVLLVHALLRMTPDLPAQRGIRLQEYRRRDAFAWQHLRASLVQASRRPDLRYLMAGAAMAVFVVQLVVFFWPIYLLQLTGTESGANPSTTTGALLLGLSWAVAYGARALGNTLPTWKALRKHDLRAIAVAIATSGGALLALSAMVILPTSLSAGAGVAAIFFFALIRFGEGAGDPLRQFLLNRLLSPPDRSTMLSVSSSFSMLVSALGLAVCAVSLHLGAQLPILFALTAVLQLGTIFLYRRVLLR